MDPIDLPECPDPDDRLFLAVGQQTGLLVTGNLKDFPLEVQGSTKVLSPKEFLLWRQASG
jgi:predicted nucleic acid-binding protein